MYKRQSKQCVKITNSNKLTEDNIQTILTAYLDRADKPHFAALVPNDKIAGQDYNLSVSTYVEQEDTREVIDIQKLNAEIAQDVYKRQALHNAGAECRFFQRNVAVVVISAVLAHLVDRALNLNGAQL